MGQKEMGQRPDGMNPSFIAQESKQSTNQSQTQIQTQNIPNTIPKEEKPGAIIDRKDILPNVTDQINLTNNMIVTESTDPNLDYNKLNCLGESEGIAVYRVQNNYTKEIRAMKIIKK